MDITKIRQWSGNDQDEEIREGTFDFEWFRHTESEVTGDLRKQILAKLNIPATSETPMVTIIETEEDHGYSEYTITGTAYSLEVLVSGAVKWSSEIEDEHDGSHAMAEFLNWAMED